MSRRATWIILISAALILLLCLGVIFYALLRVLRPFVSTVDVDAEIAKIKARGEPVSMTDLIGPRIPDSENAAVLYAKAFEILPDSTEQKDFDVLRLLLRRPEALNEATTRAQARSVINRYARALEIARQAAERPKCRFAGAAATSASPDFSHCGKLRMLVVLLAADAVLDAREGKVSRAVDNIATSLRVGECIKDEPWLVPQLARMAYIRINTRALRHVLRFAAPTPAQLRLLDRQLSSIDPGAGFVRALQGERVSGIRLFDLLRKKGVKALSGLTADAKGRDSTPSSFPADSALPLMIRPDEAFFLKEMGRRISNAHLTYREMRSRGLIPESRENLPKYAIFSSMLLPVFESRRARILRDLAETEIRGSRIVLALRSHRARFGDYPSSLAEVGRIAAVLEDPFSGKPYVYKREGKGFVLYSIGPNFRDDGGKATDPLRGGSSISISEDIVWRFER